MLRRSSLASIAPTAAAMLALAACATSPPRDAGAPYSMNALAVCRGVSVANAPATDAAGRIVNYSPMTVVRGVFVARAPVNACLSSGYGPRSGGAGSFHEGVDLYTGSPAPVLAGADGRVVSIGEARGYGLTIEIDHGEGVATRYAHLSTSAPRLRAGAPVRAGDEIGFTGRSGNATAVHLHYEILIDGRPVDPLITGG